MRGAYLVEVFAWDNTGLITGAAAVFNVGADSGEVFLDDGTVSVLQGPLGYCTQSSTCTAANNKCPYSFGCFCLINYPNQCFAKGDYGMSCGGQPQGEPASVSCRHNSCTAQGYCSCNPYGQSCNSDSDCCYTMTCNSGTCGAQQSCAGTESNCGSYPNCIDCSNTYGIACGHGACANNQRPSWYCSGNSCQYTCYNSASCAQNCAGTASSCGNYPNCVDCLITHGTACGSNGCAANQKPSWYCSGSSCLRTCYNSASCCDYSPACSDTVDWRCQDSDTRTKYTRSTACNGGCTPWSYQYKSDCPAKYVCEDPDGNGGTEAKCVLPPEWKYAPNLWFGSTEVYYPTDPFFDDNNLSGEDNKKDYLNLSQQEKEDKFTVYYHKASTDIDDVYEYWFYYAYNNFTNHHYHDWETVYVFVDKGTGEVSRVVASAHSTVQVNNLLENPGTNHIGILIEEGSHSSCTDKDNDGLFNYSVDVTNGPPTFPQAWGVRDRTSEDITGLRILVDSNYYKLNEIDSGFRSKFDGYDHFLNSPILGIPVEVPVVERVIYIPIGGGPIYHPWTQDRYNNPVKIIPDPFRYVYGRVEGSVISNAVVVLFDQNNKTYFTFTDENGNFLLNNIPPGIYQVVVNYEGYSPYIQRVIHEGNDTLGVEGVLRIFTNTTSFRISGTVTDVNGSAVENAVLDLYIQNGTRLLTTTSDENGQYLFVASSEYIYTLNATDPKGDHGILYNISGDPGEFYNGSIVIDTIPPTTTNDYDGEGLWHTADISITLNASDEHSGVKETYYKTYYDEAPQGTKSVSTDGQPVISYEDDDNWLEYWSVDNVENEETHKFVKNIKLDKTPPEVSIWLDPALSEYPNTEPLPVNYSAIDPVVQGTPSNNVSIVFDIDGTPVEDPTGIFNWVGTHTITINATDMAGWSTTDSVEFMAYLQLVGEEQLFITPEALKVNPGVLTVHTSFPAPYNGSSIQSGICDYAEHDFIADTNMKFKRQDIENALAEQGQTLDTHFEVNGTFMYLGQVCKFKGSDDISEVLD